MLRAVIAGFVRLLSTISADPFLFIAERCETPEHNFSVVDNGHRDRSRFHSTDISITKDV